MRRRDRAEELLEAAEPWDLVVLDEAHHARRRGAVGAREGGPNTLLRLMRDLGERTPGLGLLTATPMQVHPVEVWDLLDLLDLPPEWDETAFLGFFSDLERPNPSAAAMDRMASLFRSAERAGGEIGVEEAERLTGLSRLRARKLLRALRDDASIPRRQLETRERRGAVAILRAGSPVRRLISRNTRDLLRRYAREGLLTTPIADRRVEDRFIEMSRWIPAGRTVRGRRMEDSLLLRSRRRGGRTRRRLAENRKGRREAALPGRRNRCPAVHGRRGRGPELLPDRPPPIVTMEDLDRIIGSSGLLPPGADARPMGGREYALFMPGMSGPLRVTTDPAYFEEHAESVELWSPGNPLFVPPEFTDSEERHPSLRT